MFTERGRGSKVYRERFIEREREVEVVRYRERGRGSKVYRERERYRGR